MVSVDDASKIRATWAQVVPVAPMAANLFYGRLFKIAPETRALFASDVTAQGSKLMATLGFIVDHLEDEQALLPAARDLAIRHVSYNVTADQYAPVGEALIWTLQELIGPRFGADEEEAWTRVYTGLTSDMIEAAYGKPAVTGTAT